MVIVPVVVFSLRRNTGTEADRDLQLYTVEPGRLEVTVTAVGAVQADQVVRLAFTKPGRIHDVMAQVGDYVLAGDPLVQQASDTQRLEYEQALLARDMALLRRAELLEPVDESEIRIAEANVNSALGAYTAISSAITNEDIRAAELRYEAAQQALEAATQARTSAPAGQSQEAYQLLDAKIGEASFNAEIARLQLESLRSGSTGQLNAAYARVVQAQRELDQMKAGPTQAELDQADVSVQQAEAQLQQAETAYRQTLIAAPFDGIVSALNVEVGSLVAPGVTVVELTDISPLRLRVQVDEVDIRQLHENMPARVQLDALPGVRFPAVVERIALVGTNAGGVVSYDVDLRFDIDDPRVRVGMTAEASIIILEKEDVLIVPNLYVRLDRERAFVNLMQRDGSLEEVEITLGLQGQDTSEVLSGLREGDVIAFDLSGQGLSFFGR